MPTRTRSNERARPGRCARLGGEVSLGRTDRSTPHLLLDPRGRPGHRTHPGRLVSWSGKLGQMATDRSSFPRRSRWVILGPAIYGVGLVTFGLASIGWKATAVVFVVSQALLLGACALWLRLNRVWHRSDDQGWPFSILTLRLDGNGLRQAGRIHIGPPGISWEPSGRRQAWAEPVRLARERIGGTETATKAPWTYPFSRHIDGPSRVYFVPQARARKLVEILSDSGIPIDPR